MELLDVGKPPVGPTASGIRFAVANGVFEINGPIVLFLPHQAGGPVADGLVAVVNEIVLPIVRVAPGNSEHIERLGIVCRKVVRVALDPAVMDIFPYINIVIKRFGVND